MHFDKLVILMVMEREEAEEVEREEGESISSWLRFSA